MTRKVLPLLAPVLALAALAAPPAAEAQPAAGATSVVRLGFDWKPGTTARVESRRLHVRTVGRDSDTTLTVTRYTMRVESHPRGRLVRFEDFQVEPGARAQAGAPAAERLAAVFAPSVVVSGTGQFLQVDDVARAREQLAALAASVMGSGAGDLPPALRRIVDGFSTPEALNAQAASEWNRLVSFWTGSEMRPGVEYDMSSQEPLLPGAPITVRVTFGLTRRVPCAPGGDTACVALERKSAPDPEQFRAAFGRFLGQAGIPGDEVEALVSRLKVDNSTSLVVEPTTLLPHALEVAREVTTVVGGPGGAPVPMTETERRTYRFTYER